jgi:hypothetical protein
VSSRRPSSSFETTWAPLLQFVRNQSRRPTECHDTPGVHTIFMTLPCRQLFETLPQTHPGLVTHNLDQWLAVSLIDRPQICPPCEREREREKTSTAGLGSGGR